ncbi:MAG: transcriptional repressor [Chloroflexi bacterium]|nr:transcriptional repressor [Chloroflexota bacterium]
METTQKKVTTMLRQKGYRLTPQRRAVLKIITSSQDHLTPAQIYRDVHAVYPSIGLVTVYRTLDMLFELGLICELHAAGSCRSYLLRRPLEHHHHLICTDCGSVVDFTDCDLTGIEKRLAEETGFDIEDHLLEFAGHCPRCQKISVT